MEPNLKGPLKNLSEALQRAITESQEVEQALLQVRGEGFHAFLVLEVTIGLTRLTSDGEPEGDADVDDVETVVEGSLGEDDGAPASGGTEDAAFLRRLRIRID